MKSILGIIISALFIISCSGDKENNERVFVSILPQKYFVEKIAGDIVDVSVMVSPGMSPATYDPQPRQLTELRNTKLLFSVGAPFEKSWLKRIEENYPGLKIINTQKGIKLRRMKNSISEISIKTNREHNHEGKDPHIWLSPDLVKIQSKNILEGMTEAFPEKKLFFEERHLKFKKELDSLHNLIQEKLEGITERKFVVFHPSWGYFADEFNLEQVAIEIEGKEPSPRELTEIIDYLKKNNLKTIFVQPQFSKKAAETIAKEIDGKVEVIDPLPEKYFESLLNTAELIAEANSNE